MNPSWGNKPKIADLQAHNVDQLFLVEWFGVYRKKQLKKRGSVFIKNNGLWAAYDTTIILNDSFINICDNKTQIFLYVFLVFFSSMIMCNCRVN